MAGELLGHRIAAIYELQSAWMEPRIRRIGLSWTSFQLLSAVAASGGRVSQIEIAERLGVTAATLSETVHAHVKKGLLRQIASEEDRRVKRLELTEESCSLMEQVRLILDEAERTMVHNISATDIAACCTTLDRALSNLERAVENSVLVEIEHTSEGKDANA